MKKVLVTGAGGFIGVVMCEMLLKNGYHVIALDRYFFGVDKMSLFQDNPNLTILKEDIRYCNLHCLDNVDAVIDLAGLSNDALAALDPDLTDEINYLGAARLIRAAKRAGVRRYIYSSSASVYGFNEKLGLTENAPQNPQTIYAKSKVAVEKVLNQEKSNDFETVIMRNATVYGVAPRMRMDLCINIMTALAWAKHIINIENGGMQWRPFVHVRDVVQAFELALKADKKDVSGEIFNVGSNDQNYQITDLAHMVAKQLPDAKIHNTGDDMDYRSYNLNFDKIRNVLNFKAAYTADNGIKEVINALKEKIIEFENPKGYTLQWYMSLMEWEKRIKELTYQNKII